MYSLYINRLVKNVVGCIYGPSLRGNPRYHLDRTTNRLKLVTETHHYILSNSDTHIGVSFNLLRLITDLCPTSTIDVVRLA